MEKNKIFILKQQTICRTLAHGQSPPSSVKRCILNVLCKTLNYLINTTLCFLNVNGEFIRLYYNFVCKHLTYYVINDWQFTIINQLQRIY